jgi:hypothetical protein
MIYILSIDIEQYNELTMKQPEVQKPMPPRTTLPEDWLAVIVAFFIILLSVAGLFGPNGINIIF